MPIGDLLASITGEKPQSASPSPTTLSRPSDVALKRKASEQIQRVPVKAARTEPLPNRPRSTDNSLRPSPHPAERSVATQRDRPASALQSSPAGPAPAAKKPLSATLKDARPASSTATTSRPQLSKPLVNRPAAPSTDSGVQPKKRSFAEIMQRAQQNSAMRESFGKIQHKPIEKTLTMKERKELKAEEARKLKTAVRGQATSKYAGTSTAAKGAASRPGKAPGASTTTKGAKGKSPPVEEKKVKKAALATTGYQGTARPRPGAATPRTGATSHADREVQRERPRNGAGYGRSRRYEDEEEFDDFIEYDEDEEEPGYGYDRRREYISEDESDMEAGLTDIEGEETNAERAARLEDKKEMELEKRLKLEKEEKKRKAFAALKAKRA